MRIFGLVLFLHLLKLRAAIQKADASLEFVQLLHRHGDRSPTKPFGPEDPNQEEQWPQGWGQLTKTGMKQLQYLGNALRNRYDEFLGPDFVNAHTYVRSSGVERALMSSQCLLSGLFPPKEADRFDASLPWQPVPIHSAPVYEDWVMRSSKVCDRLETLFDELLRTSSSVKRFVDDHRDLIELAARGAGRFDADDDVANLKTAWNVGGNLFVNQRHRKTLPDWATDEVVDRLWDLKSEKRSLASQGSAKIKRLQGGPLLGRLLSNLKAFADGPFQPPDHPGFSDGVKIMIYSGHDTNIAALLGAMDMYTPPFSPPYGSAVLMELHAQSGGGGRVVRMFYLSGAENLNATVKEMSIAGCASPCSLEKFVANYDEVAVWTEDELMSAGCQNGAAVTTGVLRTPGVAAVWSVILLITRLHY